MNKVEQQIQVFIHPRFINNDFEFHVRKKAEDLLIGEYFNGYGYVTKLCKVVSINGGKAGLYSTEISFDVRVLLEFLNPLNGNTYDMTLGSLSSGGAFMEYENLFRVFVSLTRMHEGSNIDLERNELRLTRPIGDYTIHTRGAKMKVIILSSKTMNNVQYYVGDIVG